MNTSQFLRQLRGVWWTYRGRLLLWVVVLLYVGIFCGSYFAHPRRQPRLSRDLRTHRFTGKTFEGLDAFLKWEATDRQLASLQSLQLNASSQDLFDTEHENHRLAKVKLAKCVGLRELELWNPPDKLFLALRDKPLLEKLTLGTGDSHVIKRLPVLPGLRVLSLEIPQPVDFAALAKHPRLVTLAFYDDGSRLQCDLHELSQLQQLVITFQRRIDVKTRQIVDDGLSLALCESVAQMSHLTDVEVSDHSFLIWDENMDLALSEHPLVAYNLGTSAANGLDILFYVFGSCMLISLIGTQLFALFAQPWSRTIPGFASPHFVALGVALMGHVALEYLLLVRELPSLGHGLTRLAFATVFPAFWGSGLIVLARWPRVPPVLWMFLLMFFGRNEPVDLFRLALLRGPTGVAVMLLIINVTILVFSFRSWTRLSQRLTEAGVTSAKGYLDAVSQMAVTAQGRGSNRPSFTDRYLAKNLAVLQMGRDMSGLKRWRLAHPTAGSLLYFPWIAVFLGLQFAVMRGWRTGDFAEAFAPQSLLFGFVYGGPVAAPLFAFMMAVGVGLRLRTLPQESLRPETRVDLARNLLWTIPYELFPVIAFSIACAVATPFLSPPHHSSQDSDQWKLFLSFCFVGPVSTWMISIWLVTFRRGKIQTPLFVALIFFGLSAYPICLNLAAGQIAPTPPGNWPTIVIAGLILNIPAAAICLRRLKQVEWDNLERLLTHHG